MGFDYNLDFKKIDFRKNPELYDPGKGEQGVLLVEPYKSEILPYWKFRTVELAEKSSRKILSLFRKYKRQNDFVGMDMARKFLQMGFTRARRYANHPSGRKYAPASKAHAKKRIMPQAQDWRTSEKAMAAKVFYRAYFEAKSDTKYLQLKAIHLQERKAFLSAKQKRTKKAP